MPVIFKNIYIILECAVYVYIYLSLIAFNGGEKGAAVQNRWADPPIAFSNCKQLVDFFLLSEECIQIEYVPFNSSFIEAGIGKV